MIFVREMLASSILVFFSNARHILLMILYIRVGGDSRKIFMILGRGSKKQSKSGCILTNVFKIRFDIIVY